MCGLRRRRRRRRGCRSAAPARTEARHRTVARRQRRDAAAPAGPRSPPIVVPMRPVLIRRASASRNAARRAAPRGLLVAAPLGCRRPAASRACAPTPARRRSGSSASVPPHSRLVVWPSKRPNCGPVEHDVFPPDVLQEHLSRLPPRLARQFLRRATDRRRRRRRSAGMNSFLRLSSRNRYASARELAIASISWNTSRSRRSKIMAAPAQLRAIATPRGCRA